MVEMENVQVGTTSSAASRDAQPEVELLPPLASSNLLPVAAGIVLIAFGAFAYFANQGDLSWLISKPENTHPATSQDQRPARIILKPEDYPGAVTATEKRLVLEAPYVFNALALPPETEKQMREAISKDQLRLGGIMLWDTVAEDGDAVVVEGAGFKVHLFITHQPDTFFVPYVPGGSILITGERDGDGGITLGVATSLGKQEFPPFAPGQTLELQIP